MRWASRKDGFALLPAESSVSLSWSAAWLVAGCASSGNVEFCKFRTAGSSKPIRRRTSSTSSGQCRHNSSGCSARPSARDRSQRDRMSWMRDSGDMLSPASQWTWILGIVVIQARRLRRWSFFVYVSWPAGGRLDSAHPSSDLMNWTPIRDGKEKRPGPDPSGPGRLQRSRHARQRVAGCTAPFGYMLARFSSTSERMRSASRAMSKGFLKASLKPWLDRASGAASSSLARPMIMVAS